MAEKADPHKAATQKSTPPPKGEGKGGGKGRAPKYPGDAVIKLLAKENPKRAGTASAERFAHYKDGMKVDAALKAGVTNADLAWDVDHEFISVSGGTPVAPATEAAAASA